MIKKFKIFESQSNVLSGEDIFREFIKRNIGEFDPYGEEDLEKFPVGWSSTLNDIPLDKKIDLLKRGSKYIKKEMDKINEKPTIINIIAYK